MEMFQHEVTPIFPKQQRDLADSFALLRQLSARPHVHRFDGEPDLSDLNNRSHALTGRAPATVVEPRVTSMRISLEHTMLGRRPSTAKPNGMA